MSIRNSLPQFHHSTAAPPHAYGRQTKPAYGNAGLRSAQKKPQAASHKHPHGSPTQRPRQTQTSTQAGPTNTLTSGRHCAGSQLLPIKYPKQTSGVPIPEPEFRYSDSCIPVPAQLDIMDDMGGQSEATASIPFGLVLVRKPW